MTSLDNYGEIRNALDVAFEIEKYLWQTCEGCTVHYGDLATELSEVTPPEWLYRRTKC